MFSWCFSITLSYKVSLENAWVVFYSHDNKKFTYFSHWSCGTLHTCKLRKIVIVYDLDLFTRHSGGHFCSYGDSPQYCLSEFLLVRSRSSTIEVYTFPIHHNPPPIPPLIPVTRPVLRRLWEKHIFSCWKLCQNTIGS